MKTAIICAPGVEECEALLTYDLLFRAKIDVKLIGLEKEITSSHSVTFKVDELIEDVNIDEYDCLVLPGGMPGMKNLEESLLVQKAIDQFVSEEKLIAAVCSAPAILIHKGLLKDNEFTCFPGYECGYKKVETKAYQHKNIITGCGLGGTIEFSKLIIDNLVSEEVSNEILNRIGY